MYKKKSVNLQTEAKKEKQALERRKAGNSPEIERLSKNLDLLKVRYEQYFLGIEPIAPRQMQKDFMRDLNQVRKIPKKTTADKFKINSIHQKYMLLNNYWERTLREKEKGTYKKDLFKADLESGKNPLRRLVRINSDSMKDLFDSLQEKVLYKEVKLDRVKFEQFVKSKVRELQKTIGDSPLSYDIVFRDGKIGLMAKTQAD